MSQSLHDHTHDEVRPTERFDIPELFEQQGWRWTIQRQLVLETMQQSSGHLSAEEIYAQIVTNFPKINLSTVYRTLESLVELGLVVAVQPKSEGRAQRFEITYLQPHHHFVCRSCGQETDLSSKVMRQMLDDVQQRYGLELHLGHFIGWGYCQNCTAANQPQ